MPKIKILLTFDGLSGEVTVGLSDARIAAHYNAGAA